MTRLLPLIVFTLPFAASAATSDRLASQDLEPCDDLCAQIVRLADDRAHVVVYDSDDKIFHVSAVNVPVDAVRMRGRKTAKVRRRAHTSGHERVKTFSEPYTTGDEVLVVSTTIFRNHDGGVLDVKVGETRFARESQPH